jgi:hypothetical protein
MGCCQAVEPQRVAAHKLELADIFRRARDELPALTGDQHKAVRDIINCRTEVLGGHVYQCDHCGHRQEVHNSCRNRHCPKCQSLEQARWLQARQAELLPVEYFHVVFTVPDELKALFLVNAAACYKLLFAAVAETLKEVALNPDHLGAQIGFIAVLHTWTQTLLFHPHIHCIVPGGGLAPDGTRWVSAKPRFLLPVRVLSLVFRGKLLDKLEKAVHRDDVRVPNKDATTLLQQAARKSWVVYSKPPFAGPDQVLRYLGRYTHRTAISNDRLVQMNNGRQVTFRYKDRADGNKTKLLTLDAVEFLRRFLLHVLPSGFVSIRYYGLLANGIKQQRIASCLQLLGATDEAAPPNQAAPPDSTSETWQQLLERLTGIDVTRCPACNTGHMAPKYRIPATRRPWCLRGRATSP